LYSTSYNTRDFYQLYLKLFVSRNYSKYIVLFYLIFELLCKHLFLWRLKEQNDQSMLFSPYSEQHANSHRCVLQRRILPSYTITTAYHPAIAVYTYYGEVAISAKILISFIIIVYFDGIGSETFQREAIYDQRRPFIDIYGL